AAARRVCLRGTKIFLEHSLSLISRAEVKSEFVSASFSPFAYCLHTDPTNSRHSLFRQMSVTFVACFGRVFPISPSLPLCCIPQPARLGRFGPCRPAEGPRWPPPGNCRAGSEGEVGSTVPYQPGRLRGKIPLPDPHRSSRTSPVRSLKRLRRTSSVGSLGRRRKIV
ncbi:unnamed protein product, partial [Ascophyllum nodosum]